MILQRDPTAYQREQFISNMHYNSNFLSLLLLLFNIHYSLFIIINYYSLLINNLIIISISNIE